MPTIYASMQLSLDTAGAHTSPCQLSDPIGMLLRSCSEYLPFQRQSGTTSAGSSPGSTCMSGAGSNQRACHCSPRSSRSCNSSSTRKWNKDNSRRGGATKVDMATCRTLHIQCVWAHTPEHHQWLFITHWQINSKPARKLILLGDCCSPQEGTHTCDHPCPELLQAHSRTLVPPTWQQQPAPAHQIAQLPVTDLAALRAPIRTHISLLHTLSSLPYVLATGRPPTAALLLLPAPSPAPAEHACLHAACCRSPWVAC